MQNKNYVTTALLFVIAIVVILTSAFLIYSNIKDKSKPTVEDVLAVENNRNTNATLPVVANTKKEDTPKEDPLAGRSIVLSGYDDCTVDETSIMFLTNPKENDIFTMAFAIIDADKGKVLFETQAIAAGQSLEWKPADDLTKGKHNITIRSIPYYKGDDGIDTMLTNGNNTICITVK